MAQKNEKPTPQFEKAMFTSIDRKKRTNEPLSEAEEKFLLERNQQAQQVVPVIEKVAKEEAVATDMPTLTQTISEMEVRELALKDFKSVPLDNLKPSALKIEEMLEPANPEITVDYSWDLTKLKNTFFFDGLYSLLNNTTPPENVKMASTYRLIKIPKNRVAFRSEIKDFFDKNNFYRPASLRELIYFLSQIKLDETHELSFSSCEFLFSGDDPTKRSFPKIHWAKDMHNNKKWGFMLDQSPANITIYDSEESGYILVASDY